MHERYIPPKGSEPTEFGQFAVDYFPPQSRILDLGAGAGLDSIYFAGQGHEVVATDISDTALNRVKEDIPDALADRIKVEDLDLTQPFPYADESFDVVYAATALHYFDSATTDQIFSEIHRVLKPGGVLATNLNSKTSPEFGRGKKLEEDYYETEKHNIRKRFFSPEDVEKLVSQQFKTVLLDDKGSRLDGVTKEQVQRIRFIGKKL